MASSNGLSTLDGSDTRQKDVRNGEVGGRDALFLRRLIVNLADLARRLEAGRPGAKVAARTQIARELSALVGLESPWSWRYVQGVEAGTISPSEKFVGALRLLLEEHDPRRKQWFYFLRRRSLAAVFDKSILREQVVSHMKALGFRCVTFKVYDRARKRIRSRSI